MLYKSLDRHTLCSTLKFYGCTGYTEGDNISKATEQITYATVTQHATVVPKATFTLL